MHLLAFELGLRDRQLGDPVVERGERRPFLHDGPFFDADCCQHAGLPGRDLGLDQRSQDD